jgi:hypothetical protein
VTDFRFDAESHRYYLGDEQIPSVTQVLEPLQELEGIPRGILESARDFGIKVHSACALMINKSLDWRTLDPQLVPYVSAARKFLQESGVTMLRYEHRMVDPSLKIAGTLDFTGMLNRYAAVFDWKTTAVMGRTVGLQLAAYDHLYRLGMGSRPLKRYGVQLREDGSYRLLEYKDPRDFNFFKSALNIWWWRNSK